MKFTRTVRYLTENQTFESESTMEFESVEVMLTKLLEWVKVTELNGAKVISVDVKSDIKTIKFGKAKSTGWGDWKASVAVDGVYVHDMAIFTDSKEDCEAAIETEKIWAVNNGYRVI